MNKRLHVNNIDTAIPEEWHYGDIDTDIIKNECLHNLFEASADLHPDNIAVVYEKASITYKELEELSNRLARYLIRNGVKTGDKVGILIKPSFEMYTALLAVMKAGAAYVPIDTNAPEDRILFISQDCSLRKIITTSELAISYSTNNKMIMIDKITGELEDESTERLMANEVAVKNTDLCYIIYTSGSTGRPKGVQTEHRSACNLVRASQKIYKVVSTDRVYQGFTIAFDASVEELWMAFSNGAALVAATTAMKQSGKDLPHLLNEAGVTVFSTVSTLLSLIDDDLPKVRLLIQGGESCTQQLISKWAKPGRTMMNTYGPTEATVIATYAECIPGKPVTIGRPLSNYSAYIVDENLKETGIGEPGELCLGGISLSRGYLNRDDLTKEKFIDNPFAKTEKDSPKLYKTGDLAQFNKAGEIEFLGRIDTQVKIRGYRVELSEIEAVISLCDEVSTSVVTVFDVDGIQSLVAYIVPKDSKALNTELIYDLLVKRLPAYMIPTYLEIINNIPTLPSGKTDRKSLPKPSGRKLRISKTLIQANNDIEIKILKVWREIFKTDEISTTDDFFNDLGGHSLLAALAASKLREDTTMRDLTVSDIYGNATIKNLAKVAESRGAITGNEVDSHTKKQVKRVSGVFHKVCGLFQGVSIYMYYFIMSMPFVALYLYGFFDKGFSNDLAVKLTVISIIMFLGFFPATLCLSVIIKWIVIGRYKEGDYPVWGLYYFRWWFVRLFRSLVPIQMITGTPIMSFYLRVMGAKVGKDCYIGTTHFDVFDLISIGDNSSIGFDVQILSEIVEDGYLKLRKINIGDNCYVGPSSVLSNSSCMLDNSQLGEQSMLPEDTTIPSNERWCGSPAKKTKVLDDDLEAMAKTAVNTSKRRRLLFGIACFLGQFLFAIVPVIAILPGFFFMLYAYDYIGIWAAFTAPVLGGSFNLFMCLEIALIKKLLIGKIEPGHYRLYTKFYYKKWFVDQLMSMSLTTMHCLYATLYTAPFFKLLGSKIGNKVEVSTVAHISPDLLTIKDESFVADAALIGTPKIFMGQINISETMIGKRTFIGNSALIPINTVIGDNCLIGVLSLPPEKSKTEDGTSWLGSPAMFLPKRDINTSFTEKETFKPSRSLYTKRCIIEFIRAILPATIDSALVLIVYRILDNVTLYMPDQKVYLIFPLIMLGLELATTLGIVALKILLIGRYKQRIKPLWSTFVWKSELITGLYESVTVPGFLGLLTGTPYIRYILRLFGVKIGKRSFIDTTDITEFDLVEIAEECNINHCTLQTHLFEDRVMKMSKIKIEKYCTVGIGSVVLYDTVMKEASYLGNLSLLMKGESLISYSEWQGIPVERKNNIISINREVG